MNQHSAKSLLKLPVPLRALGDEVRKLKEYHARGLITQEEADERLADWGLNSYPPGWADVEILADLRRWGGDGKIIFLLPA